MLDFSCKLFGVEVVEEVEVKLMRADYLKGRTVLTRCDLLHYLVDHYHLWVDALQIASGELQH